MEPVFAHFHPFGLRVLLAVGLVSNELDIVRGYVAYNAQRPVRLEADAAPVRRGKGQSTSTEPLAGFTQSGTASYWVPAALCDSDPWLAERRTKHSPARWRCCYTGFWKLPEVDP